MAVFNKIALFFVVLYSVIIILNTYFDDYDQARSNMVLFFMNGFAYIVSAIEIEREKEIYD